MPLFGSSKKNPTELVKNLKEALNILEKEDQGKKSEKAVEDVAKLLTSMKNILFGAGDQEPQAELVAQLSQEFYNHGIFHMLISSIHRYDFEAKKDVVQIFNNILRRQIGTRSPTVDYLAQKSDVLFLLLKGYENSEISLHCGMILRECIRHEPLAKIVLHDELFYSLFAYVEMSTFDIASDAFTTFKELLTRHKILCAEFLDSNYDRVFSCYRKLLDSDNYVTKRQSLKEYHWDHWDRKGQQLDVGLITAVGSTKDALRSLLTQHRFIWSTVYRSELNQIYFRLYNLRVQVRQQCNWYKSNLDSAKL